jgi:proton-coupled amino acid transporter
MASPRNFNWVLSLGMSIVISVYLLLSVFGYLSCGAKCLGSFTLNLPNTP